MVWKMIKRIIYVFLILTAFGMTILITCYWWIEKSSAPYLYSNIQAIPKNRVALVLGTAKYLSNNRINPFYSTRIEAAIALYKAGKVEYIIVSGANPSHYYNEPNEMRKDLIRAGIPEKQIQPDYAGLRTLDSILRADKVFGNQSFTVISQPFHNSRAIFLARHKGLDVIAYNARDPIPFKYSIKTRVREF